MIPKNYFRYSVRLVGVGVGVVWCGVCCVLCYNLLQTKTILENTYTSRTRKLIIIVYIGIAVQQGVLPTALRTHSGLATFGFWPDVWGFVFVHVHAYEYSWQCLLTWLALSSCILIIFMCIYHPTRSSVPPVVLWLWFGGSQHWTVGTTSFHPTNSCTASN